MLDNIGASALSQSHRRSERSGEISMSVTVQIWMMLQAVWLLRVKTGRLKSSISLVAIIDFFKSRETVYGSFRIPTEWSVKSTLRVPRTVPPLPVTLQDIPCNVPAATAKAWTSYRSCTCIVLRILLRILVDASLVRSGHDDCNPQKHAAVIGENMAKQSPYKLWGLLQGWTPPRPHVCTV